MEQVIGESNKVLLDVPDGASLMYLPLDQIVKQGGRSGESGQPPNPVLSIDQEPAPAPQREVARQRRSRR
jgi:membrane protease subunit HflK